MLAPFTSILITGASSGLGAALARAYAAPGIRLALQGRDGARLEAVAEACRAAGAAVETAFIDVTDAAGLAGWIAALDDRQPLDLVIANAGISGGTSGLWDDASQARRIFAVNLDGVLNTIGPAIARMRPRRHGSVAIMSSLASFRGLAGAPAYGASKAAVRVLGESLRGELLHDGVRVSVICPGFVTTPMTARNRFHMPFLMDAERAAGIMRRGLDRGRARIAFPWQMLALVLLIEILPAEWTDFLLNRLPRKARER
jgi:short-subunit dehydrogenase